MTGLDSAPSTRLSASAEPPGRRTLAAVAVVSCASLLLELGLTRIFSVVLFYHFAFLAISLALLGLGAGGVFAFLRQEWLRRWSIARLGWTLCLVGVGLILLALGVTLYTPVTLELTRGNFVRLSAIYFASALPFFVTGVLFSVLFARQSARAARLYAYDLGGGALACLAIVPLLNWLGGPAAVLCSALVMALAAALWAEQGPRRHSAWALALVLCGLIAGNHSLRWIDVVYAKGLRRDGAEFARWNAISRVDVIPETGGERSIAIDADAATLIARTSPDTCADPAWKRTLLASPQALVNIVRPRGEYAIIGPGGGIDVMRALCGGSPSVTGIEINSIIVDDIMRREYAAFSVGLYQRPDVHIHVGEGRSWIRGSSQTFDVIQMTLVDTWASTAAGAFALSENNLYTVEAFREYFDHLKPDGILTVTRWEFEQPREALRVVSLDLAALQALGVRDSAGHFAIVSGGALTSGGRSVTVLAKKSPFTVEEIVSLQGHLSDHHKLVALYMPWHPRLPPVDYTERSRRPDWQAFNRLISAGSPDAFAERYPYDVRPVKDDAPFFFFTMKTRDVLAAWLHRGSSAIDWKVNLGVAVLFMLLLLSLAAVALFVIGPLVATRHARVHFRSALLYFVAIGLGFILAEIAFIQRFVLFLGHPTYAVTVVIFLMLLASGLGSLLSPRWLKDPLRVRLPLLLVALFLLVYVFVLSDLLRALVGWPFGVKLLVSAAVLFPLGFCMGMPFPSGLRALAASAANKADAAVEWAWALNAGTSVLGSVLAMIIAIYFGLNVTLGCAALAYVSALALTPSFRTR